VRHVDRAPAPQTETIDLGEYVDAAAERDWIVEGAIEGTPIVLLTGPEKSGKSWLLAGIRSRP